MAAEAVQALSGPRGVLVVEYPLGAEALVAGLLRVHALYQVVVEFVELEEAEDHHQEEVESLVEPSNVADPVQQTVDIPIDSVKVQVKLKSDLQMHPVRKLVRSHRLVNVCENLLFVLCEPAELEDVILQT